jgi:hypothetical protein
MAQQNFFQFIWLSRQDDTQPQKKTEGVDMRKEEGH